MANKNQDNTKASTTGSPESQAQAGGKTSPAGGAKTFESNQQNQGKPQGQQGGNKGSNIQGGGNPYPPVTPERPMMAEGQGKSGNIGSQASGQKTGQQGFQGGQQGQKSGGQDVAGSQGYGATGSNVAGQELGAQSGNLGAATPGLEEEE